MKITNTHPIFYIQQLWAGFWHLRMHQQPTEQLGYVNSESQTIGDQGGLRITRTSGLNKKMITLRYQPTRAVQGANPLVALGVTSSDH